MDDPKGDIDNFLRQAKLAANKVHSLLYSYTDQNIIEIQDEFQRLMDFLVLMLMRRRISCLDLPDPDPMHLRARAAIEKLGLDGAKLELAVAIFGWGSDEANGSLLGLVVLAWGEYWWDVSVDSTGASVDVKDELSIIDDQDPVEFALTRVLVAALEAKA